MITQIKKLITEIKNKVMPRGFLDYWRLKKTTPFAQIATIFTILIMVVFLLTVITVNVGRVALIKTRVSNAADSAALAMVSTLGSMSHYFTEKEGCEMDWGQLFDLILALAGFVISLIPGGASIGVPMMLGGLAGFVAKNIMTATAMRAFNRKMQKLNVTQQIGEGAILNALGKVVDDDNFVTDIHDYDEDGETDDKISYFVDWYSRRLDQLDQIGNQAQERAGQLRDRVFEFLLYTGGMVRCAYFGCDNDLDPDPDLYSVQCHYWSDSPSLGGFCYPPNPLPPNPWVFMGYDDALDEGIIWPGIFFQAKGFRDWFLVDTFIPLLDILENGHLPEWPGYPVSFWQTGENNDQVDELLSEMDEFYFWGRFILGYYFDNSGLTRYLNDFIIKKFAEFWIPDLYRDPHLTDEDTDFTECPVIALKDNPDDPQCAEKCKNRNHCAADDVECNFSCETACKPDWYTRLGTWSMRIGNKTTPGTWIYELDKVIKPQIQARINEIIDDEIRPACVASCNILIDACCQGIIDDCKNGCCLSWRDNICIPDCSDKRWHCEWDPPAGCRYVRQACEDLWTKACVCPPPPPMCAIPLCCPAANCINLNCPPVNPACLAACAVAEGQCLNGPGGCVERYNDCRAGVSGPWDGCRAQCEITYDYDTCMATNCNHNPLYDNCVPDCITAAIPGNSKIVYLNGLITQINTAIIRLDQLKTRIDNFRSDIKRLAEDYYDKLRPERIARYSWANKDAKGNLIWHHVQVNRSTFIVPYANAFQKFMQSCTGAKNKWGHVCVKVIRYDSKSPTALWDFHMHPILTDDSINVVGEHADYKIVTIDQFDDAAEAKAKSLLADYGIKSVAYACFGPYLDKDAQGAQGGFIGLTDKTKTGECYR
ncbi:MAG: Tad domain-containing protein [Candidatus Omnitrophota bacterium]